MSQQIERQKIQWCCLGFHGNYDEAGKRGMSVLVGRNSLGDPEFTLQFRAVDIGKETSVEADEHIPVLLGIDVGMQYCPWCGRDLESWYGEAADGLYRPDLKI